MAVGRKTKLTKPLLRKLKKELSECPPEYACPAVGITERTFYNWKRAAVKLIDQLDEGTLDESQLDASQELLVQFFQVIEEASAELQRPCLEVWRRTAQGWKDENTGKVHPGNWIAAKELLARLNPNRFGNTPPGELNTSSDNESLPPVLETPGFENCYDPESQFLQVCAAQQKATKDFAAQKQKEEQGE